MNADGFVVAEIIKSLQAYIAEKTKKVAPYRSKYHTWWLAFVDYVGQVEEAADVQQHVTRSPDWDRVIILGPDGKSAYDL